MSAVFSRPYEEMLNALFESGLSPSPLPLLQARDDRAMVPLHIQACLKSAVEAANAETREQLKVKLGVLDMEHAIRELLKPVTHAWHPPDDPSRITWPPPPLVPPDIPQALKRFRLELKRCGVPVSDDIETALTEALASAMLVLKEDNALLERVAKAYDNNPNNRHEVGRIVAIREMALSGRFDWE